MIERMLWFDEQVRAGRHPGSASLAARFGVSLRTARRDIEFLRNGIQAPLKAVPGTRGYAYEDPGFYLPSSFFRKEELFALLIARKLFGELRPPLKEEMEGISARLADLFKVPLMERIRESVSFEIGRGMDLPGKLFFDLLRAITRRKTVLLRGPFVEAGGRPKEVGPLRLHFARGNWYLAGIPSGRKGIGIFPLERIRSVEVTARDFQPGRGASGLDSFLRRSGRPIRDASFRDVRIRFHPARSSWASRQAIHPDQRLQFELDGSAVLELPTASFLVVLGIVLLHDGEAVVVGPRSLKAAVDREAERLGG